MKQKKRHYSLLAETEVAHCQQFNLREKAVKLMLQINNFCARPAMLC